MRPKPFVPRVLESGDAFVRDETSGLVWHRVFNRSLYGDTDRSQVVYHANYLRYFEMGRAGVMRALGYPYRQIEESGTIYPIFELGVKFFHPLRYDDPMWIHSRPSMLERVKAGFDYVITQAESGDLVCTGFTHHCALNENGKPTEVDVRTVEIIQKFPK